MKRFLGLLEEDLKSKLWLVVANWYVFGMFCLILATKMTIPAGEVRSLYTGPGNTSFFAAMVLMGIVMGPCSFRYLYSEKKSDLYFGLPVSRGQLFWAGYLSNLLIFLVPAAACKLFFFRISLSMGYCRYEDSICGVWLGCIFLVLGFLVVSGFSMLAFLLAQNHGYMLGLLLFFFFGPGWGFYLTERMLGLFYPSFYKSEALTALNGCLTPLSLLVNGSGVKEFADSAYWEVGSHLPYIGFMAAVAFLLTAFNCLIFVKRPVERKGGVFTFRWVESLFRYGGMILAMLWLVDVFRIFTVEGMSPMPAVVGAAFFLPLVHGFINAVIAFDAKKYFSAGRHLLAEGLVFGLVIGIFMLLGKQEAQLPSKEEIASMAFVLTAQKSGDGPEDILENMELTGEELKEACRLVGLCEETAKEQGESYDILVKYNRKDGKVRYRRCRIPLYQISELKDLFAGEEFKRGTYGAFRLEGLKYYEIRWTNGLEDYTLDLDEEERTGLWEAYKEDMAELTFSDICLTDPSGMLTFASTKNQGDVTGYLYPGFRNVNSLLKEYGVNAAKRVSDYEITKIVMDQYLYTDGLLYDVRALEFQKTYRDEGSGQVKEMAMYLVPEEFCVDYLLFQKDRQREYTVYYRDSEGKTVGKVKCLEGR